MRGSSPYRRRQAGPSVSSSGTACCTLASSRHRRKRKRNPRFPRVLPIHGGFFSERSSAVSYAVSTSDADHCSLPAFSSTCPRKPRCEANCSFVPFLSPSHFSVCCGNRPCSPHVSGLHPFHLHSEHHRCCSSSCAAQSYPRTSSFPCHPSVYRPAHPSQAAVSSFDVSYLSGRRRTRETQSNHAFPPPVRFISFASARNFKRKWLLHQVPPLAMLLVYILSLSLRRGPSSDCYSFLSSVSEAPSCSPCLTAFPADNDTGTADSFTTAKILQRQIIPERKHACLGWKASPSSWLEVVEASPVSSADRYTQDAVEGEETGQKKDRMHEDRSRSHVPVTHSKQGHYSRRSVSLGGTEVNEPLRTQNAVEGDTLVEIPTSVKPRTEGRDEGSSATSAMTHVRSSYRTPGTLPIPFSDSQASSSRDPSSSFEKPVARDSFSPPSFLLSSLLSIPVSDGDDRKFSDEEANMSPGDQRFLSPAVSSSSSARLSSSSSTWSDGMTTVYMPSSNPASRVRSSTFEVKTKSPSTATTSSSVEEASVSPSYLDGDASIPSGRHTPSSTSRPTYNERDITPFRRVFFTLISIGLVLIAGLASGLTTGFMAFDELQLLVLQETGDTRERKQAEAVCVIVQGNRHQLLVTLLLCNSLAMEALPLFLDRLLTPLLAVLISVTAILFVGEILPQALCTGKHQLAIAAAMAPVVRLFLFVFAPLAFPISKLLDRFLSTKERSNLYARSHLKALIGLHQRDRHRPLLLHHHHHHLDTKDEAQPPQSFHPPAFPTTRRSQSSLLLDRLSPSCRPAVSDEKKPNTSADVMQNDGTIVERTPTEQMQRTDSRTGSRERGDGSSKTEMEKHQGPQTDDGLAGSSRTRHHAERPERGGERVSGEEGTSATESDHAASDKRDRTEKETAEEGYDIQWRVTREEMDEAVGLHRDEVLIMQGALDMACKSICDFMVALEDVYMLDCSLRLTREVLVDILRRGHSRIPVYEG
ncbi:cbs domain-containing protein [Cystoisospora suis]|uniref:Cbs domain-containing protein n=1 Tax=Cystoisospora suis TaxID=483139 RepID=A0A2C6KYZ8_9APIC|nr:cbs domain-containing protein [Cystoisospora suis]